MEDERAWEEGSSSESSGDSPRAESPSPFAPGAVKFKKTGKQKQEAITKQARSISRRLAENAHVIATGDHVNIRPYDTRGHQQHEQNDDHFTTIQLQINIKTAASQGDLTEADLRAAPTAHGLEKGQLTNYATDPTALKAAIDVARHELRRSPVDYCYSLGQWFEGMVNEGKQEPVGFDAKAASSSHVNVHSPDPIQPRSTQSPSQTTELDQKLHEMRCELNNEMSLRLTDEVRKMQLGFNQSLQELKLDFEKEMRVRDEKCAIAFSNYDDMLDTVDDRLASLQSRGERQLTLDNIIKRLGKLEHDVESLPTMLAARISNEAGALRPAFNNDLQHEVLGGQHNHEAVKGHDIGLIGTADGGESDQKTRKSKKRHAVADTELDMKRAKLKEMKEMFQSKQSFRRLSHA